MTDEPHGEAGGKDAMDIARGHVEPRLGHLIAEAAAALLDQARGREVGDLQLRGVPDRLLCRSGSGGRALLVCMSVNEEGRKLGWVGYAFSLTFLEGLFLVAAFSDEAPASFVVGGVGGGS